MTAEPGSGELELRAVAVSFPRSINDAADTSRSAIAGFFRLTISYGLGGWEDEALYGPATGELLMAGTETLPEQLEEGGPIVVDLYAMETETGQTAAEALRTFGVWTMPALVIALPTIDGLTTRYPVRLDPGPGGWSVRHSRIITLPPLDG